MGSSKSLLIRFQVDNSAARAATRQTMADLAATGKAAERSAAAMTQHLDRAATAAVASSRRVADAAARRVAEIDRIENKWLADDYRRRLRAEQNAIASAQRTAAAQSRASERAAKAAQRKADMADAAAKREAERAIKEAQRKADAVARADQRAADAAERRRVRDEQKAIASEKRIEKARVDAAWRTFAQREKAEEKAAAVQLRTAEVARRASAGQKDAANGSRLAWLGSAEASERVHSSLTSIIGTGAGLATVVAMGGQLDEVMGKAAERAEKAADEFLRLKGAMREFSVTQGNSGVTDATAMKYLDIRAKSGLNDQAAQNFLMQYSGANESNIGVNISREESEKAKVLLAQYAASQGGGPEAAGDYGRFGGQLQAYYKGETAESSLAHTAHASKILGAAVGDNPTLIRNALKSAGLVLNDMGTGAVKDPQELMALIGTASLTSPAGAGEQVTAAHRALRVGPHAAEIQAAIGGTDKDDIVTSIKKLNAKLEEQEKQGKSPDMALKAMGVTETEDLRSLLGFYSHREQMDKFMGMAHEEYTPEMAKQEIAKRQRNDTALQDEMAQAQLDKARHTQAMQGQHFPLLKKQAQARITARGDSSEFNAHQANKNWLTGKINSLGGLFAGGKSSEEFGEQIQLEQELFNMAKERGIKVPGRPENTTSALGGWSFEYLGWLRSGAWQDAYSSVGSTMEMTNQVMPGGPPAKGNAAGVAPNAVPQNGAAFSPVANSIAPAPNNLGNLDANSIAPAINNLKDLTAIPAAAPNILNAAYWTPQGQVTGSPGGGGGTIAATPGGPQGGGGGANMGPVVQQLKQLNQAVAKPAPPRPLPAGKAVGVPRRP